MGTTAAKHPIVCLTLTPCRTADTREIYQMMAEYPDLPQPVRHEIRAGSMAMRTKASHPHHFRHLARTLLFSSVLIPTSGPSAIHRGKQGKTMPLPNSSIFGRDDTLLGICEGLAQDLQINPLWLRLAFLPFLFVFPAQTIGAYLAIGAAVWLSRTLFPALQTAAVPSERAPETPALEQMAHAHAEPMSVPIAA